MMSRWKIVVLMGVMIAGCVGCDQATKQIARETLQGKPPIQWLNNTIQLHYTENLGAFLNLGSWLSARQRFWLLLVAPALALSGFAVAAVLSSRFGWREYALLACLLGGGLSNLIDRAYHQGAVSDFLNIGIGNLRTGVFNVADVLIMVGAIGLLLLTLFTSHHDASIPTQIAP